jgi:HK97 family phage major capsid protein
MALSTKHKEALTRFQARNKELSDFLESKGDNITAADLTQAHAIRDDLRSIKAEVELYAAGEDLQTDSKGFQDFVNKPTSGMRHQAVVGPSAAGSTTIERPKKGSKAQRMLAQSGPGIWGREKFDKVASPEYRNAFLHYLRKGEKLKGVSLRNLEDGLDPQGGYLAPVEVLAKLIERQPTPTRIQDAVDVVNTSRDAVSLPLVNYAGASDDTNAYIYTTGFRATATDENPTSDTQAQVTDTNIFGSIRVPVYTWLIEGVLTNNQVEDAMFDPMAWMTGKFLETIKLLRENMIVNGSGIGQSTGILTQASSSPNLIQNVPIIGTASSGNVTADSIITISEDVPEQYDENCRFAYAKTSTGKQIRLLKDSQNRYLFGLGYQDSGLVPGKPKALNGYPTMFSQFVPAPAANSLSAIFGDFMGYTQVNRVGFSIQVLREIAARRNQVIILGRVRFGGLPVEPWRLRALKLG